MSLTQLRLKIAKVERAIEIEQSPDWSQDPWKFGELQHELDALLMDLKWAEESELDRLRGYSSSSNSSDLVSSSSSRSLSAF